MGACLKKSSPSVEQPVNKTPKEVDPKEVNVKPKSGENDKPAKEPKSGGIEEKYTLGNILGKGAFSVVREGISKETGTKYAIKCITKKMLDKTELELLQREIVIMEKLNHPHIIELKEVVHTDETLYLVLEFVGGGELFDSIVEKGAYSEEETAIIVKQILEAISYVHKKEIAHRDLKPENLLLANTNKDEIFIKIADFGLSKEFGGTSNLQTACGTPDYVAPEVISGEAYDRAVDVWSIGVITYVLLCGFPPFNEENQNDLFDKIMTATFDFPDPEWTDVSEEAKDFIKKILVVNPEERMTSEQCLQHPWLTSFTDSDKKKANLRKLDSFSVAKFKEYQANYRAANNKAPLDVK